MRSDVQTATILILVGLVLAGCIGGSSPVDTTETDPDNPTNQSPSGGEISDDLKAHVHDRWDGQEVVTVVSRDITIEPISRDHPQFVEQCRQYPTNGGPMLCFGTETFFPDTEGETGKIVPPGTEKVEVTLEFGSGFDQIRFFYQDRMSQGQWDQLGTFEEPGNMTIQPIPVVKSDDGHAKVSAWKFRIEPKGNPYPGGGDTIWYGEGDVEVTIEAHREEGELPLEPAHPDFWDNTSTYEIGRLEGQARNFVQANRIHTEENTCGPGVAGNCVPIQLNSQGLMWNVRPGYQGQRLGVVDPPQELSGEHARALVPPKSNVVAANVTVDGNVEAPVEVCLRAMTSPDQGPYGEVVGECMDYSGGSESWTIERQVSEREVDSFYTDNTGQNASRWTFLLQVRAPETADQSTVGSFDGSVSMSVFVSEEASFSLPTWAGDGS